MIERNLARREFIGAGAAIFGLTMIPAQVLAALPERRLALRNVHTNERIDACYFSNGCFRPDGIAELNHGLRDWRTNQIAPMDPGLFDLLTSVRDRLGVAANRSLDLISGYRSPATNGALHARSGGVATKSQHMLGKASDIAIPGITTERLRDAALSLERGGVGYYPRDGFVHVDTGRVRRWG